MSHIQPKKFRYKRLFKKRNFYFSYQFIFNYGFFGFFAIRNVLISDKHFLIIMTLLKKLCFKNKFYLKNIWFLCFPAVPITRKILRVRMGKGKGKFYTWAVRLYLNHIFLEFKDMRYGRIILFFKILKFHFSSYIFFLKKDLLI